MRLCATRYRQVIAKVSNMCEVVSKAAKVDRKTSKGRGSSIESSE